MGAVYLCEDLRLPGKHWALKEMIVQDPGIAEQVRDSFFREARFLAGLRHRSLPLIVDVFSIQARQYLVMEYIEGQTLAQRVERQGVPSDTLALSWALELAQVLDYLHRQERPIIFRDLKPENIMLTEDGHIKVIDFGLARHFEPGKRRDTQASGTVGYAPPEQWEDSGQSDPRSDIYSLAATLYFVLTGKPPSPVYGSQRIRPHRPDIDPGIEALVLRCLAVKPSQRYSSAAELIRDLSILLSEERHQGALHESDPRAAQDSLREPPTRVRAPKRTAPLKTPLGYPQQLSAIIALAIVMFVVGALLPFLDLGAHATIEPSTDDRIAELLEKTEEAKARARKNLKEGQFKEAIANLDALVTRHPQDAEAHILKNNAYAGISGSKLYRIPVVTSWHGSERGGFQMLYGWSLAQSQINGNRAGDKPLLYLELQDDRSDPERLLGIVEKLVNDSNIPLMLGPYTSQQTRLIAPIVNGRGLPTITPVASDPQVLSTGRHILCVADTDTKKVKALADHLYAEGGRRVAIFTNEGSIISRSLGEAFLEQFQDHGGLIALNETYPKNQVDFTAQVKEAQDKGADCIFLGEYRVQPVISFSETLKTVGWDIPLASQTAGFADNLFRRGNEAVEGMYLSTYYVPEMGGESKFLKEFENEFGRRRPTHREVNAYDSLNLAVEALDSVGPDRAKLLEYLSAVGDDRPPYQGVSGTFALSKNLEARRAYVLKVTGGSYTLLESP